MRQKKWNTKRALTGVLITAIVLSGMPVTGIAQTVDQTYRTGTYTGEAAGYKNGTVTVTITLEKDADSLKITDISADGSSQTQNVWNKAKVLLTQIKEKNGTDGIDVVSGATYSSKAILEAADAALLKAAGENIFDGGTGTKTSPYQISSKETLLKLDDAVASGYSYEGKYITLTQSVDLAGVEWVPVGTKDKPFSGNFDGKGYEISNLTIGSESMPSKEAYAGLFGFVTDTAKFSNVTLKDIGIYTNPDVIAYAGGVVAFAKVNGKASTATVLQNCHVSGTITVDTSSVNKTVMAGGIIGFGNQCMTVANCGSKVDLTVKAGTGIADVGGILGFASAKAAVLNSYYMGQLHVSSKHANTVVGGILGGSTGMLYNNYASAVITTDAENISTKTGAIIGNELANTAAKYCYYDSSKTSLPAAGAAAAKVTVYTAKTTEELNSDAMKEELNAHFTTAELNAFSETVKNAGMTDYDFDARLSDIDSQFYGWTNESGVQVHEGTVWTPSEIDASIFAGGDGTLENPYQIANEEQLRNFAVSLTAKRDYKGIYLKLINDIDVSSAEWTPAGEGEYAFNGNLDGDGHTISGITIGTSENPYQDDGTRTYFGLFGVLEKNAEIKNLSLTGTNIYVNSTVSDYVGGLAGFADGCLIDNVSVSGTISGKTTHQKANNFIGGITGAMLRTKIINSHSDASVRSEAVGGVAEAGGISGMNNRGLIANCYVAGTISGNADRVAEGAPSLGGIAGVHAGTIVNSYSVADVVADCYSGYIGSVAGWATGIADTFQTYYAKDAKQVTDDKTENRLEISPAVAIGWQVGPGVNDEGEKYTGSVSIDVTGFTTEDMISDFMAAVLNQNFGKLKINLANGGRQTGHWTGSEALSRSLCSWKVDENTLLLDTHGARVIAVYDTNTPNEIAALLPADEEEFTIEPASGMASNEMFASGDGTKENPWTIETEDQLIAFATHVNKEESYTGKYICLMKDITLTKEWIPAGATAPYVFSGTFDGNGHTISGMTIGSVETPYKGKFAGLFAYVKGGKISNLSVKNAKIYQKNTGNSRIYTGIVAAAVEQDAGKTATVIDRISADGQIGIHSNSGAAYAGGISGQLNRGNITNCETNVSINAVSDAQWVYAGGISGMIARAGAINNYAQGSVTATAPLNKSAIGGICGFQSGVCYNDISEVALKAVNATGDIGGLAGRNTGIGMMLNSYFSTAEKQINGDTEVTDKKAVGTVVAGENDGKGEISDLTGTDSLAGNEMITVLNNNLNDNAAMKKAQNLLNDNWENPLSKDISLLTWENAGQKPELKGLLNTAYTGDSGIKEPEKNTEDTKNPSDKNSDTDTKDTETKDTNTKDTETKDTETEKNTVKTKVPKKGKILKDKTGTKYKVTKSSAKNGTVSYVSPKNGVKGTVTIPATIKISGITYKVTSIKADAFKGNKKITKVTIGKNVTEIGKNAFSGCTKLKTVIIGNNVKSIGANAFSGCKNLKNITVKSTKLTKKNVGNKAFAGTSKNAVVKVPSKKLKLYKSLLQSKGIDKKAKFKKI